MFRRNAGLGAHTVTVLAHDAAGNLATNNSQSYRTDEVVYLNSGALGVFALPLVSDYLFATFGKITKIDDNTFDLDHGTGPVRVSAPAHGLQTGDYAYVHGTVQIMPHLLLATRVSRMYEAASLRSNPFECTPNLW